MRICRENDKDTHVKHSVETISGRDLLFDQAVPNLFCPKICWEILEIMDMDLFIGQFPKLAIFEIIWKFNEFNSKF